jgi:hypothetical protein
MLRRRNFGQFCQRNHQSHAMPVQPAFELREPGRGDLDHYDPL